MLTPSESDKNYGFEWWLLYEKQAIVIDEQFLEPVKLKGDTVASQLLQKLKGKFEGGMNEVRMKAANVFTKEELQVVAKALSAIPQNGWKIENIGSVVGYVASGYLGQNLVIIPEKNLVVVRMITTDNFKKIPNNSQLPQLRNLVYQL